MNSRMTKCLVGLFTGFLAVANAEVGPLANVPENFSADPAGWAVAGSMSLAPVRPGLTLQFPGSSLDPNVLPGIASFGKVAATASASSGRFVGNYSNSAIDRVAFDVTQRGIRVAVLQLKSAIRVWQLEFPVPEVQDQVTHVEIPLKFDAATWGKYAPSGAGPAEFAQDMMGIVRIAIWAEGKTTGGYLAVDNFKLVGPWEKGAMTADGLAMAWLELNKLPVGEGQAALDADGDGFNNRAEFIAGTNPNDANSKLVLKIASDADGKSVLRWKKEDYRGYRVMTATDLTGAFSEVSDAIVKNAGTEKECSVDGTEASTKFYKVEIK